MRISLRNHMKWRELSIVTRVQVRRMVHGGRGYNVGRSKVNCNLTVYVLEGYWAIRSRIRERAFGCPYSVLVRIALLLDVSLLGNKKSHTRKGLRPPLSCLTWSAKLSYYDSWNVVYRTPLLSSKYMTSWDSIFGGFSKKIHVWKAPLLAWSQIEVCTFL